VPTYVLQNMRKIIVSLNSDKDIFLNEIFPVNENILEFKGMNIKKLS
jgi:hypothetical protein